MLLYNLFVAADSCPQSKVQASSVSPCEQGYTHRNLVNQCAHSPSSPVRISGYFYFVFNDHSKHDVICSPSSLISLMAQTHILIYIFLANVFYSIVREISDLKTVLSLDFLILKMLNIYVCFPKSFKVCMSVSIVDTEDVGYYIFCFTHCSDYIYIE